MRIGRVTGRVPTNLRFGTGATLLKWGDGAYVDGMYVAGTQEATTITLHKQPATDDDRSNLPEGERLREAIAVWVKTQDKMLLRPMTQGNQSNTRGDIIVLDDLQYEVTHVDNYTYNNHIYAICMRIENQND